MTTSYLLIRLPKELFLLVKLLPMTTQVLHSRLLTKATTLIVTHVFFNLVSQHTHTHR